MKGVHYRIIEVRLRPDSFRWARPVWRAYDQPVLTPAYPHYWGTDARDTDPDWGRYALRVVGESDRDEVVSDPSELSWGIFIPYDDEDD